MPQLPITPESLSTWARASIAARRYRSRATKAVMRSHHLKIPVYDVPLRFRPWFVLFTSLVMITLAFLGFTNFAHALPINDKLLHFFCLMLATGIFYFIFDVEEDAKRIWFWRYAPLISTGIVCFFFGGILSEVVQSLLPYKEFQIGDVIANLLGSSLGLYIAYHLERYYRHRREISRLYRPLNPHEVLLSDDEDYDLDPLLPTHTTTTTTTTHTTNVHPAITSNNGSNGNGNGNSGGGKGKSRLGNVWDESEELFDIGGDSDGDDDDEDEMRARTPAGRFERRSKGSSPSR